MTQIAAITGSIARGARIIDVLAQANHGLGLNQIVARSEFTKTTAFRVLANLQDVGYVYQDPETRLYMLGRKLHQISQMARRTDIAALAQRGMQRLALKTEDTIFLSVPEGSAAICVARTTGAFPIRTLTLNEGDRRPLGVGAGALALFCAMSDEKRRVICKTNKNWMTEFGITKDDLSAGYKAFCQNGYAANIGRVVAGTSAISVPILTAGQQVVGALAIGAIDARMSRSRIDKLLFPALKSEAEKLTKHMNELEQG